MKNKNTKSSTGRLSWMLSGVFKSKKAEGFVDTAVKVLIAVVIGALLLYGLYGLMGNVVIPTTSAKVNSMFNFVAPQRGDGVAVGEGGTHAMDFNDGPCVYTYYSSLEKAIEDANNHTTANTDADLSNAVAVIAERESDGAYIVKPLVPVTITAPVSMTNEYIFDANGQTVSLADGAHFLLGDNAQIAFRDSGDGCIVKDVCTTKSQFAIICSGDFCNLTILNGEYLVKSKQTVAVILVKSIGTNFAIDSGFIKAVSDEKIAVGIMGNSGKGNNFYFKNCTIQAYSNAPTPVGSGSSTGKNGMAIGVLIQSTPGEVTVENGIFTGYSLCNRAYGMSITDSQNRTVAKISGGEFYGATKVYGAANVAGCNVQNIKQGTITGGVFSGVTGGAILQATEQLSVTGGDYEGSDAGGVWFGNGNIYAKHIKIQYKGAAVLKASQYFAVQSVQKANGEIFTGNSCATQIGSHGHSVAAYMDSCELLGVKNIIVQNQNSSSVKTSAKLYMSNMICDKIELNDKGGNDGDNMLFLGKGVSYNSIEGTGAALVDTITYKDREFCQDIA